MRPNVRMLCPPAHKLPAYGAVLETRRFSALGAATTLPMDSGGPQPPGARSVWDPDRTRHSCGCRLSRWQEWTRVRAASCNPHMVFETARDALPREGDEAYRAEWGEARSVRGSNKITSCLSPFAETGDAKRLNTRSMTGGQTTSGSTTLTRSTCRAKFDQRCL